MDDVGDKIAVIWDCDLLLGTSASASLVCPVEKSADELSIMRLLTSEKSNAIALAFQM